MVCINGWGMTRCHPLTFFKKQQEKDMNMKPDNSYKLPIYRAFSGDLLMGVTNYKVCDTINYGII